MIPAFAIGAFGVGLALALWFGLRQQWVPFRVALIAVGAVFAYCWLVAKNGEGFEDIGYAIVAFLICLPGAAGLLAGGLVAWLVARQRRRMQGPQPD